ncbi:uncharacterized protein N7518_002555 [Penicillium psychrosexuale]|uniref:uncharacterized protein n=1 Tax=Penicillium psychrosexuale TaxID=1002107 RepID=UPI002545AD7A|nr:uncharacterized protein N7518_002555 [Penicillium psychrosexuale]KAJ5800487.1 hypothetical protein N7518_002555 [Penicillium psychrosexuale]
MLARLKNIFTSSTNPSVLLVVGKFGARIHVLHLIPEDGTIERFCLVMPSSFTTFRYRGARELSREQIGTVTLDVGDGVIRNTFLDDVKTRIYKLQNDSLSSSPAQLQTGSTEVTQLVQDVLRPVALDAIHEREVRDRSMRATETYPVFIIYITRSPGRSFLEMTSYP